MSTMQSKSTGVWYYECARNELDDYLLDLQSKSVLFPDEYEFLLREHRENDRLACPESNTIKPLCYKSVTIIPKDDKVEIIINRDHEKIDQLSKLPSRSALLRTLDIWFRRDANTRVGIVILELNEFSNVNDSLGHATGDLILYDIARRLETFDLYTFKLIRVHGDEYAIAVKDLPESEDIWKVSNWIKDQFTAPFSTHSGDVFLAPSLGLALNDMTGNDPVLLLEAAYIALNYAKDNSMVKESIFTPKQHKSLTRRVTLEASLNQALSVNDQLEVWYQPKQNLKTGKIYGAEALIRWQHPADGLISPGEFIPLAERTGLIRQITDYVMAQICQDIPALRKAGLDGRISINISAKDFSRTNIVADLTDTIKQYRNVEASDIELEITEGAFINDFDHCLMLLAALKDKGFELSIDDFGTGYSSLSYLTQLPVDTVKIDMSFAKRIVKSEKERLVYKAMISICEAVGHKVLAEGIDDKAQREILKEIGCHGIQGYLLSKPVPLKKFIGVLKEF